MSKLNVAVAIGGKSPEHAISLISGNSVIRALNPEKYNIYIVGIDKNGTWWLQENDYFLEHSDDPKKICLASSETEIYLANKNNQPALLSRKSGEVLKHIDIIFPVLHGAYGEDGVVQGLFNTAGVAYVGADLLSSAVGMDKDFSKRLWRDAGIPLADYFIVKQSNRKELSFNQITKKLGLPIFVKPANAGSSVGVSKVSSEEEYEAALDEGFLYDRKLLIEEAISGIEVECAILGNEFPKASAVGAIIPTNDFYSYEAKYLSDTGAKLVIPAEISEETAQLIQKTAVRAFQCVGAEGLSRVDFFLTPDNNIVLNEINTMPGFTSISMYPKLWAESGLPYSELLDELINLGLDRHKQISQLKLV